MMGKIFRYSIKRGCMSFLHKRWRATLFHLIAAVAFLTIAGVWFIDKEGQIKEYKQEHLKKLEAVNANNFLLNTTSNLALELKKSSVQHPENSEFIPSQISSNFLSQKKVENNATITKINLSLSKKVFSTLEKYQPFMMTTKAQGKDYVITFLPMRFKSTGAEGYLVSYTLDDTLIKIERHFTEKLFLLVMLGLLLKGLLMGWSAYRNVRSGD